jgi:hypothetical protein
LTVVPVIEQNPDMHGRWPGTVLGLCVSGLAGCGSVRSTNADGPPPDDASISRDDAIATDAAVDAAVDTAIDTPVATTRFDIGYINDLVIVPLDTTQLRGLLLVVNKGTVPLDLSTASVLAFSDDADGIDWQFSKRANSTFLLDPGRAAGSLGVSARPLIVDQGVVTERIDDNALDFQMDFLGTPASGVIANAQAIVRIDGVEAVLTFKITTVSSAPAPFQYNTARRVSSQ